jgi:hypothetical protein
MLDTVIQAIISVLSGLVIIIPLIIKLVEYIKANVKSKNWTTLLSLVTSLMQTAELKYTEGAKKKEFVIAELKAIASSINYDIDWVAVDTIIDQLCAMSKVVNVSTETAPPVKKEEIKEGAQ